MQTAENQKEILELFKQGPANLEKVLSGLSEIDLDYSPSNGGWSIRQIIHHIADGDDLWKTGIKIALGNEHAEFTLKWYGELPQTEWAKCWSYEKRSIEMSLALLRANRDHIIQLLAYTNNGWDTSIQLRNANGEIEFISVGAVIQMQSDHIAHHIRRILAIREEISNK